VVIDSGHCDFAAFPPWYMVGPNLCFYQTNAYTTAWTQHAQRFQETRAPSSSSAFESSINTNTMSDTKWLTAKKRRAAPSLLHDYHDDDDDDDYERDDPQENEHLLAA
jgi:hypothetical protein